VRFSKSLSSISCLPASCQSQLEGWRQRRRQASAGAQVSVGTLGDAGGPQGGPWGRLRARAKRAHFRPFCGAWSLGAGQPVESITFNQATKDSHTYP
jgi:hypothetical protein